MDGLKVLSPTVEGARYVPLIFDRVITGDSRRDIAAWLDAEGIATANGGKWSETVSAT